LRKLLLLIAIGLGLYQHFSKQETSVPEPIYNDNTQISTPPSSAQFSCQGKTHCSQMSSFEEAKFYLDNCPGTKMDGDGDGIPCERQF
jgi:hypothetical protein